MHHHDIEIIMALAEGSLDPEAAEAARVEIAACEECRSDLEMQTSILASLHELPEVSLTEMESARLRRNVRDELGIATATPLSSGQQRRRRMPLAALATAAAVLVAVVVVGPALDLIGGADSEPDETIVAEAPVTTAAALVQADGADPEDLANGAAEAAPPEVGFASTTTVPARSTTAAPPTTLAPIENLTLYAYFAQAADLGAVLDVVVATDFDAEASRSSVLRLSGDSIQEEHLDDSQVCASVTISSDDNLLEGFQVARGLIDGREVLYIVYLAEDLEESVLIAQAADNCEELARASL